ncbi:hypothetical protein QUB12_32540 [Microcoleus sp. B7-D4]
MSDKNSLTSFADCLTSAGAGKTTEPLDSASMPARTISIKVLERSHPCLALAG